MTLLSFFLNFYLIWIDLSFIFLFRIWWVAFRAYPFLGQCRAWPVDSQSSNKPKMHIGKTSVKHRWNIGQTSVKHWSNIGETSMKHQWNIGENIDENIWENERFFLLNHFNVKWKQIQKYLKFGQIIVWRNDLKTRRWNDKRLLQSPGLNNLTIFHLKC
jgi:hypothetical protein